MTQEFNYKGRMLYDQVASKTPFINVCEKRLMMRIGILDCSTLSGTSREAYGSVGELVINWLSPHFPGAPNFTGSAFQVGMRCRLPVDLTLLSYRARKRAFTTTPNGWRRFRPCCLRYAQTERPLVGICFGHQLMAHTFGGRAEKADLGMGVGTKEYLVDGERLKGHVLHQDQVR